MEQKAKSLVYRRLTYADFRHINKKSGEEEGGGGQSYIDVSAHDVTVENWIEFLGTPTGVGAEGRPRWTFPINSLGVQEKIDLTIAQRRAASVSITSQKIYSRAANRVPAWRPENSFPTDYDPMVDNLVVYIIKTDSEQFWAGWLLKDKAPKNWEITPELSVLFGGEQPHAGYIVFRRRTFFDTEFKDWPFYTRPKSASNQVLSADEYEEDLRDEDTSSKLPL